METSIATDREGALLEELGWLRTLARRLLADPNDAEDVVQEAWLKTREVVDSFSSRGRLRAWLTGLVHRMARDTMRARRRREWREEVVAASARQDAEDGVERLAALESLLHTVRMLDEPLRAVVLLRYLDGHTTPEIASALGISEDLVRKRLTRGRAALRRALGVPDEATDRSGGRGLVLGASALLLAALALSFWVRTHPAERAALAFDAPAVLPHSLQAPATVLPADATPATELAAPPEAAPVAEIEPASTPAVAEQGAEAGSPADAAQDDASRPAASDSTSSPSARPAIGTGPE